MHALALDQLRGPIEIEPIRFEDATAEIMSVDKIVDPRPHVE